MQNDLRFYDKTILTTPNPIHSSSMTSEPQKRKSMSMFNDIPIRTRLSDVDSSLGVLSINSEDFAGRFSDAATERNKEAEKARNSLRNFDLKRSGLTSIPSRFLQPCDISESSARGISAHSESTISESDLFPGNSSTPRGSLVYGDYLMRKRSISRSISNLASSLMDPNNKVDELLHSARTMDLEKCSFHSGPELLAQFEEDEKSWQQQRAIPVQIKGLSISSVAEPENQSLGSFFFKKSDDLNEFARSPSKCQPPVPLIETTVSSVNSDVDVNSLDLSDIQQILQSEQSATKAIDELCRAKKPVKLKNQFETLPVDDFDNNFEEDAFPETGKENISPEFHNEKSILSTRSSSSLSSLPNGKLPIATTKTEIIWGCIKPGKCCVQEFTVRNRSASRVGIQCTVSNPSFRLNKEGAELNFTSMVKLALHPYESRTLTIIFAPTSLGSCVDNLVFTSTDPNHKQTVKQFIKLTGYGGYGNVTIHKVIKDTTGKFLLSLGNIDEDQVLKQAFVIKNFGSLPTFTYFDLVLNGLYPFSIEVSPKKIVLLPGEEREVCVTYELLRKDMNYIKSKINSCVIDIGKLQVIHGTEVDRARLRKICQKAKEKNQGINSYVLDIVTQFPGEVAPKDLKYFRESISAIEEILKFINREEITLTLEQEVDRTLTGQLQDETAMFQSLCENTTLLENTMLKETCQIEPTRIILTPPDKMKDRIFLSNNNKKQIYFEVNSTPEGLHLKPRDGTVNPGETLIIELQYTPNCNDKTVFKVRVLVDNESFDVDVKIVFVG